MTSHQGQEPGGGGPGDVEDQPPLPQGDGAEEIEEVVPTKQLTSLFQYTLFVQVFWCWLRIGCFCGKILLFRPHGQELHQ